MSFSIIRSFAVIVQICLLLTDLACLHLLQLAMSPFWASLPCTTHLFKHTLWVSCFSRQLRILLGLLPSGLAEVQGELCFREENPPPSLYFCSQEYIAGFPRVACPSSFCPGTVWGWDEMSHCFFSRICKSRDFQIKHRRGKEIVRGTEWLWYLQPRDAWLSPLSIEQHYLGKISPHKSWKMSPVRCEATTIIVNPPVITNLIVSNETAAVKYVIRQPISFLFLFMYMRVCHIGVSPQEDQKRESDSLEV